jgi:hypothetical protein
MPQRLAHQQVRSLRSRRQRFGDWRLSNGCGGSGNHGVRFVLDGLLCGGLHFVLSNVGGAIAALAERRLLANAITEEVELGPVRYAVADHFNLLDAWAVHLEGSLNANA